MQKPITTVLWLVEEAEEAAKFYTSIFPNSEIVSVNKSPIDWPGGTVGDVITIDFTLSGQPYQILQGGPQEAFNDRVSLSVTCRDQEEVDRYWDALTADGGKPVMCGWLQDKYGMRWQIVPQIMVDILQGTDFDKRKRAMEAMVQMVKFDVSVLEAL